MKNGLKLSDFSITYQINLITAIVTLGLILLAGLYIRTTSKVDHSKNMLEHSSQKMVYAAEIRYDFLNARRNEKDFLNRKDLKYVDKHTQISDVLQDHKQSLKKITKDASQAALIETIVENYTSYDKQFDVVVDSMKERGLSHSEGLEGALRKSVHNIENELGKHGALELNVLMLMMRRHEKDFIMRLDSKYVKKMHERVKQFEVALAASELPFSAQENITKMLRNYHKDFNALAETSLQIVDETKKLSALFAQADPYMEELVDELKKEHDALVEEVSQVVRKADQQILMAIFILGISSLILAILIGRKISNPIVNLTRVMARLADNDLEVDIPAQDRKDEVGQMASAVMIFKENAIEVKKLEEEQKAVQKKQLERADLLNKITLDFDKNVSDLMHTLSSATTELDATAQSMSSIATETVKQANEISSATDSTTENIQSVAGAAEELSASIKELSQQVNSASDATGSAVVDVDNASSQIEGLSRAAEEIGNVVSLIQDIAEQTNLLALNATIESARAGEAGKGFAVVANEVKTLAGETGKATEEIARQIEHVQIETRDAVAAIKSIEEKIRGVNEAASSIAAAIEEQNASTEEISRNTNVSSNNMTQLKDNTRHVTEAAQNTGMAAEEVLEASKELSKQSTLIRDQISKFLEDVKAA